MYASNITKVKDEDFMDAIITLIDVKRRLEKIINYKKWEVERNASPGSTNVLDCFKCEEECWLRLINETIQQYSDADLFIKYK